jgi:hypothetical protein
MIIILIFQEIKKSRETGQWNAEKYVTWINLHTMSTTPDAIFLCDGVRSISESLHTAHDFIASTHYVRPCFQCKSQCEVYEDSMLGLVYSKLWCLRRWKGLSCVKMGCVWRLVYSVCGLSVECMIRMVWICCVHFCVVCEWMHVRCVNCCVVYEWMQVRNAWN